MAKILAVKYGAHLLIVARRAERLNELKAELETRRGREGRRLRRRSLQLEDVESRGRCGDERARAVRRHPQRGRHPLWSLRGPVMGTASAPWLDTNVTATVRMATAFIPHLEAQGVDS